ncbi:WXG100 family type VII secretion target [Sphaerisporangium sp. TRM90804]|uniref:WXG100 family type VII secretion target n=1 Tax=Sphaerisporangium sp. TRM90804 TaxID=3031113 RepID=UPI0024475C1F|nr:WXG100 family type VII secretion target [Sphaerisporangium sp. TRM90804]MDH2425090.1 WXG100 family type VII secretion target [Sphaerisporangium sp. TRM90804]
MGQQTAANLPQIVESSKKTDTAHQMIGSIQTQLQGHVADLRSGWGGQSGMAFESVYSQWNTELGTVLRELQNLAVKLREVEARYRSTEEDQAAAANRVLSANINN